MHDPDFNTSAAEQFVANAGKPAQVSSVDTTNLYRCRDFFYTNYKGETRLRRVANPKLIYLRDPGFGYQAGWFLHGHDLDKNEMRSFALTHIRFPEGSRHPFFVVLDTEEMIKTALAKATSPRR